jgi:uncharacterized protein (TIGR02996 family)
MAGSARPEVVGLLAEAKARPGDDLPRLVLADFLEDSADPIDQSRGEFLRLQCQLARMARHDPARPPLQHRMKQLLQLAEADWLGPLSAVVPDQEWKWQRGLLWITVRKNLLRHAEAQLLLGTEALAWVEGFHLCGNPLLHIGLRALADCPSLAAFHWIDLGGCHITAGERSTLEGPSSEVALAPFLGSPHLGRLTHLGLSDNRLHREDLDALASTRKLTHLEHLDLSYNGVRTDQLIYLLENPALSCLTSLRLGHGPGVVPNPLQDDWSQVAASPALSRLIRLDLRDNTLGREDVRSLALSPHLGNLAYLDLSGNPMDHIGALARSPSLNRLVELRLDWEFICPRDQRELRERFGSAVPPEANVGVGSG